MVNAAAAILPLSSAATISGAAAELEESHFFVRIHADHSAAERR